MLRARFQMQVLPILALLAAPAISASPLTIGFDNPDPLYPRPGGTVTFRGTILNSTGIDLAAQGMFFNFSSVDQNAVLRITQLLGRSDLGQPLFDLPDATLSPHVDLFEVLLMQGAPIGATAFAVQIEDIYNNLGDVIVVSIEVVPEPSALILSVLGLAVLCWRRMLMTRQSGVRSSQLDAGGFPK